MSSRRRRASLVFAAPLVFEGKDGIFSFFQSLNGVYFIPLLAIILFGFFNRTANGTSALITAVVGLLAMAIGTFYPGEWRDGIFVSGYHYMGVVFVSLLVLQAILGISMRRETPYFQKDAGLVDLTPWKPAPIVGAILIIVVLGIYISLA